MKKLSILVVALMSIATVFAQKPVAKNKSVAKAKVVAVPAAAAANAQAPANGNAPLKFKESKFSFGKIKQGVPVTHKFTFTNNSGKPVFIENATAQCGCTTPVYPKGAIGKGATEKIEVTYNAAAVGSFTKQVTVKVAKQAEPIILTIEGEVVEDKKG